MRRTINLDCKTHHVSKDGTFPILLRVSINGDQDYFNIGKRIKEKHYDKHEKAVKPKIKGYGSYTEIINRHKVRIEKIIDDFDKKGEVATISKVKKIYEAETGRVKSKSFCRYVEDVLVRERALNEISSDTLDNYDTNLIKLKNYRPNLSIYEIDKEFLEDYKSHLQEVLKLAKNTIHHELCFLRKYTKKLFNDGAISKYPFADFIIGKPFEVDPAYLEPEELKKLHDIYDSKALLTIVKKAKNKHAQDFNIGEKYQEILRYYLAACYCGLRHSDIKTLIKAEIKGDEIVKELQKGRLRRKKTVRIPIQKRLLSLLDLNNGSQLAFESPVMECSQTNKYLMAIMKYAEIDKHITFHSSRHTFAINSLLLGITFEVISNILGHSELSTTQRYARVVDRLKKSEMKKWDNFGNTIGLSNSTNEILCINCENVMLRLENNVIQLNKIPCVCQYCSTNQLISLKSIALSA